VRLCFFLLLLVSSCVFVFTTFKRVLCPPLSAYRPIYCELMRHLRAVFCLFIDMCASFARVFIYSSTCVPPLHGLSFPVRELDTQLFVVPQTMHVCARVFFYGSWCWRCLRCLFIESLECCERRLFCLHSLVQPPGPPKASLALKCFCLRVRYFYLVHGFLEIPSFQTDFIYASELFA
jgi:hypothetical protein